MESVQLAAHFDGDKIVLDEPYVLEPDMRLQVIVVKERPSEEHQGWADLSRDGLARAYGEEPEYGLDSLKETNPDYEGR